MSTNSGGAWGPPGSAHDELKDAILDVNAATSAKVGGSHCEKKKMRSFQQILTEEKERRNILEIKMRRLNVTKEDGSQTKANYLSIEDVIVLIFEILKINPDDCHGVALVTSKYDTKEIKLKPEVDPSIYLTSAPIQFKDHEVTVSKQTTNVTKVTFKNVPFNIPDEEIINLCESYGNPINNIVSYDRPTRVTKGVSGSTRHVEMEILPGKQFENFYWLEGPLEGDQGSRITVLHNGQVQQCSHCLRRADSCPGGGMGKVCEQKGTSRGLMSDYMHHLKLQHNYVSLKIKFQTMEYPQLQGQKHLADGFKHMVETPEDVDQREGLDAAIDEKTDSEKDSEIAELKTMIAEQKKQLEKTEAKSKREYERRLLMDHPEASEVAKIVIEHTNEILEYDAVSDSVVTKDEEELKRLMEERCKGKKDNDKEMSLMKNQVLEKVRILERNRLGIKPSRSRSFRRGRSEDSDSESGSVKSLRLASSQPITLNS